MRGFVFGSVLAIGLVSPLRVEDIDRAQKIARAPEADRARFHGQYVIAVGDPLVTEIEVISEFRRAVLITEEHLRKGDWMFAQSTRAADEALSAKRGLMTLVARLRFNPLNAYATIPDFRIAIAASPSAPLATIDTRTTPTISPPFKSPAGVGTALLGAVLEGDILEAGVDNGVRPVGVVLDGKELARAPVDFRRLD